MFNTEVQNIALHLPTVWFLLPGRNSLIVRKGTYTKAHMHAYLTRTIVQ